MHIFWHHINKLLKLLKVLKVKLLNLLLCQHKWNGWKISLVYDKSVQHATVYGSYDGEIAAQKISNVKL